MRRDHRLKPTLLLWGALLLTAGGSWAAVGLPHRILPPADTGAVDTGVVDTGVVDTGAVDTGTGGDTGAVDSGTGGDTGGDTGSPLDTGAPVDTGAPTDTAAADTGALDTAVPVTSAAQLTDEKGGFACSSAPASGSTWFGLLALALLAAVGRRSR